jgi:ribonuclease Z
MKQLSNLSLIPLGTSAAIPAHGRHLTAHALDLGPTWILFDCGEGAQYQIMKTNLRPSRLSTICITHLHGDHVFGLPGLLTSMAMAGRTEPLTIVAPTGLFAPLRAWPGVAGVGFPVVEVGVPDDLTHAVVVDRPGWTVEARPLDHRIFCAGYRWQEKAGAGNLDVEKARALGVTDWRDWRRLKAGEAVTVGSRTVQPSDVLVPPPPPRAVAFVTDTAPCAGGRELARGASLVVHDSTFGEDQIERAAQTGHSTAAQAAAVARDAQAERLLLTHFSARYETADALQAQAQAVFPPSHAATERQPVRLPRPSST